MKQRGELLERPFAHVYTTGGMRRTHLRRHDNILKRLLIHIAGFNLGLLMRQQFGVGTPRSLQGRLAAFLWLSMALLTAIDAHLRSVLAVCGRLGRHIVALLEIRAAQPRPSLDSPIGAFTTGC